MTPSTAELGPNQTHSQQLALDLNNEDFLSPHLLIAYRENIHSENKNMKLRVCYKADKRLSPDQGAVLYGDFSTGREPVRVQPSTYGKNQRRAFPPGTVLVLNQEVGSEREPSQALVFPSEP